jgi:hypothetical protein
MKMRPLREQCAFRAMGVFHNFTGEATENSESGYMDELDKSRNEA